MLGVKPSSGVGRFLGAFLALTLRRLDSRGLAAEGRVEGRVFCTSGSSSTNAPGRVSFPSSDAVLVVLVVFLKRRGEGGASPPVLLTTGGAPLNIEKPRSS